MRARIGLAILATAAVSGCGSSSHTSASSVGAAPPAAPTVRLAHSLRLLSPALTPRGAIRRDYTCDGRDVALPLRWSGVPRGTRELVLAMRDPDAPSGNFVHWAVAGIAPTVNGLGSGPLPPGAVEGRNSFGALGYRGPCPPAGAPAHHYVLTLSALSAPSGLHAGFTPDQIRTAALAITTLVGTYARR